MSHIVIYRAADGQPAYHQTESVEEAVRHVEWLRNAGQGAEARIFRMQEVPIEVKTYYRVEVSAGADHKPAPAPAPAPVAAPVAAPVPPAQVAVAAPAPPGPAAKPEPAGGPASSNGGRFGLFGKG